MTEAAAVAPDLEEFRTAAVEFLAAQANEAPSDYGAIMPPELSWDSSTR